PNPSFPWHWAHRFIVASFFGPQELLGPAMAATRSPIGHLLRSSVQSRSRNMVSSEAKNGFNCVSCGTFQGARRGRASSAKREPRPNRRKGGVSGTLIVSTGEALQSRVILAR